jgi:hypothetical protein
MDIRLRKVIYSLPMLFVMVGSQVLAGGKPPGDAPESIEVPVPCLEAIERALQKNQEYNDLNNALKGGRNPIVDSVKQSVIEFLRHLNR